MATNLKKRKPDQESDLLELPKPAGISYIPKHDDDDDDDEAEGEEEDVSKLLEPLTKEQLISLLRSAALAHPPTLAAVRAVADLDPSHRKIFVHGLAFESTAESLRLAFSPFGPIDDIRIVTDRIAGRSKGYGFILFRNRKAAKKALKQPQKLIDGRMTACQLASVGPPSAANPNPNQHQNHGANTSDNLPRKVFVRNVHQDIDAGKLRAFFAQFGEIEEGPLGFDRATGKPKGFALFVYKTLEGARKALEESSKNFEGHMLVCQRASDNSNKGPRGPMGGAQNPGQNPNFGHNPNANANAGLATQNVAAAAVPGSVGAGYPGQQAMPVAMPGAVPGAVPDMTALLAQGLSQPNALLAMLAAAQQNQAAYGLNPAVLASLNPAAIAAAFGGAAQNVPPAPGVQQAATPVTNQGYGGVTYQQNVGGFQGPPGFQAPAGYQNVQQMGAPQSGVAGSYQGGAVGQAQSMPRPPAGQMGGYGPH